MWIRQAFKTGASVAIVIPSKVAEMKGWHVGSKIVITVGKDKSVKLEGVMEREKTSGAAL